MTPHIGSINGRDGWIFFGFPKCRCILTKVSEVKEIRFTPNTDDHDFDFKSKHAENFLKGGNKVKAYVHFRGRSIAYKEKGEIILLKFAQALEEYGKVELLPKLEGNRMFIHLAPIPRKKK